MISQQHVQSGACEPIVFSLPTDRLGGKGLDRQYPTAFRAAAPVYLNGIADHCSRHLSDGELRSMHDALSRVLEAAESSPTGSRSVSSPERGTGALGAPDLGSLGGACDSCVRRWRLAAADPRRGCTPWVR